MTVYDENGEPIDALAVASEDLILTLVARLDLLDDDSLSWLARRMVGHAEDCKRRDLPGAEVYRALVRCIEHVQRDVP